MGSFPQIDDATKFPEVKEQSSFEQRLDMSRYKAKHLLAKDPPPRRYVVGGLIPEPIVAAIVAPGETGKSFLTMQMAVSIATGLPFMGLKIPQPGAVLMLGAEDDADEINRRLHSIVEEYQRQGSLLDTTQLGERFYPLSLVGQDNLLTTNDGREWNHTKIQQIIGMAQAISDLRLIIIDPVSRFRSGEENNNVANTRFVEALESIRTATGVTVLASHHSRKGGSGDDVDEIRGGSAFVDAIRFAALLSTLKPEDAEKAGIDKADADKIVRFKKVKCNYRCDVSEFWLERTDSGVLFPRAAPVMRRKDRVKEKGEALYAEILPKVVEVVKKHAEAGKPLSARKLREEYGGTANTFGIGKDRVDGLVKRAVREGAIRRDDKGRLHAW